MAEKSWPPNQAPPPGETDCSTIATFTLGFDLRNLVRAREAGGPSAHDDDIGVGVRDHVGHVAASHLPGDDGLLDGCELVVVQVVGRVGVERGARHGASDLGPPHGRGHHPGPSHRARRRTHIGGERRGCCGCLHDCGHRCKLSTKLDKALDRSKWSGIEWEWEAGDRSISIRRGKRKGTKGRRCFADFFMATIHVTLPLASGLKSMWMNLGNMGN